MLLWDCEGSMEDMPAGKIGVLGLGPLVHCGIEPVHCGIEPSIVG